MNIKKICFVCNGNNSRSIMAEYIARKVWQDKVEVCSCGINADDTQEVGQNTQAVLEEIDIKIAGRKRRKISKELIGDEYYYFALDNTVMEKLVKEYGISSDKVRILDARIFDPKGCAREIYRECRNIIELAIGAVDIDKI